MVRKKSAKQALAAKNKGTHRPKDTELTDIGIRSSRANMSKATDSDVTEPKGAQKVLEEKQNLNELLLDSLPHDAMLIRKDRTVLAANRVVRDAGAKVGGYCWHNFGWNNFIPAEDKKYIRELKKAPPGDTRCCFCLADQALKNQKPARNPELNVRGKTWDVHWVPLDEQTYLHYAIDITERKANEDTLRASEQRYKLLLGAITDGFEVLDHELRYLLVNDEIERMAQLPKETLLGSKITDLFPGLKQTVFFETFKKVLKTGKSAVVSDEFVFEDGRRRWYEAHTYPAPEGILVIVRDITERKEAQKDLSDKNIALREVLAEIREQKNEMGRMILSNVDKIIMPLIHILEPELPEGQQAYMDLLKQSLQEIASPFVSRLSTTVGALTPTEMRICGLIRRELSNKEIAQLEHISPATVSKHRAHIRRKLGITNKKVNLATHLESFMPGQEKT